MLQWHLKWIELSLAISQPPATNFLGLLFYYSSLVYFDAFMCYKKYPIKCEIIFFFFLIYVGCPGQLTRITTIPHGPLDILQAQEQVRHRGGDRRAHRGSNPGRGWNKSHSWPQQLDPQVQCEIIDGFHRSNNLLFSSHVSQQYFFL
jgi:hypothetical protein